MSNRLVIAENPFDSTTWVVYDNVENIIEKLSELYETFPDNARLYHNDVSMQTDITPTIKEEIDEILEKEGTFFCVHYPEGVVAVVAIIVAVVAVAAAFFIKPSIPAISQRNQQQTSPNNALSDRQNEARPGKRIPYIVGTVLSIPDLVCVPYKTFDSNQEVEHCTMCITQGAVEIHSVRDDETPFGEVAGNAIQIYNPNESIDIATPFYRIGTAFNDPVYSAKKSSAITGQTLRAPNTDAFSGNFNISFMYPNIVLLDNPGNKDFTDYFAPDDVVDITNSFFSQSYLGSQYASYAEAYTFNLAYTGTPPTFAENSIIQVTNANYSFDSGTRFIDLSGTYRVARTELFSSGSVTYIAVFVQVGADIWNRFISEIGSGRTDDKDINVSIPGSTYNVNGQYTVLSVSNTSITLDNASAVNPNWDIIEGFDGERTQNTNAVIQATSERWVGPYTLTMPTRDRIIANFVGLNGLYKDDGQNQEKASVEVIMEVTPIDASGNPIGSATEYSITLQGSATSKDTVGITMDIATSFVGNCSIRFRRVTPQDKDFNGSVVDEVKVRDLYAVETLSTADCNFGNVTMLRSKTYATASALSLKDRKIKILVTRKLPRRNPDNTFTTELYPTTSAADIFCAVCLEPTIGNRQLAELDVPQIYSTIDSVVNYFGTTEAAQFCYTFDDSNVSFEETASAIADAVFCKAYRRGSQIRLTFEKATEDSVILFNHRNKLPGSESRTVTFGYLNDNDGVELTYVSPEDDAIVTYYIPEDQSAINPKKIETIGVRSYKQAYLMAWRAWNKMRYQTTVSQFTGTDECSLLLLTDRIANTDNTRPIKMEGDIISVNGLELTCSQEVKFEEGKTYNIFLQLSDATVQSIPVIAGSAYNKVVLQAPPRLPLVSDSSYYARTTYQIVASDDNQQRAFLVTEIDPQSNYTSTIKAVNYDSRYYARDKDFIG